MNHYASQKSTDSQTDFLQRRLQQQQHTANILTEGFNLEQRTKKTDFFFWTKNCRTFIKINVHLMSLFSWQSPRAVETFWRIWSKHISQKLWMYKQWANFSSATAFISSLCFVTEILFESKKEPSYAVLQHDGYVECMNRIRDLTYEKKAHICCYNFCELWMLVMWTYVRQAFFFRPSKELIYWLFVWLYFADGFLFVVLWRFSFIFGSDWKRCFWQSVGIQIEKMLEQNFWSIVHTTVTSSLF